MLWLNPQDKPQLSIHLYSPQITVINGSNSNLLVGYVSLTLGRPTTIKSLRVTLSGIYSAYWINGTGQSRQEYYQNKRFHQDTCMLTRRNLQSRAGSRQFHGTGRREVNSVDGGFAARSRSSSTSSECPSEGSGSGSGSGSRQINYDPRHVVFGLDDGPVDHRQAGRAGGAEHRIFDDDLMYSASNPVTPTSLSPPQPFSHAAGSSQYHHQQQQPRPAYRPRDDYRARSNSIGGDVADDLSLGFELGPGTHLLDFCFPLPPKLPSTIVSEVGGIDYSLSVQLKTKGSLSRLPGTHLRATCPVHVVNLPSRYAHMQADLPVCDEAVFSKQVEASWWIMARLSTRTASPGDVLRLGVTLSWPARIPYEDDPAHLLRVVSVRMDLVEATVYRSLATGNVIKNIEACVASSDDSGVVEEDLLDLAPRSHGRSHSHGRSTTNLAGLDSAAGSLQGSRQGSRQGSMVDLFALAITPPSSEKPSRSVSPEPSTSTSDNSQRTSAARSMFNERFKRTCSLRVPEQRLVGSKARSGGVHIDCRSAPLSVVHEVRVTVRVHDLTTGRTHCIPFASRLVIVPESEAFMLPAYTSSALDTRVL